MRLFFAVALAIGLATPAVGVQASPASAAFVSAAYEAAFDHPDAAGKEPSVPPPSANAPFVTAAFQVVLHRSPDAAALAYFVAPMNAGTMSQMQMVGVLIDSTEFRTSEINALYQNFLGRNADGAGINAGLGLLASGATPAQVAAPIVTSPEYFGAAGGTDRAFFARLYTDALGRNLDSTGFQLLAREAAQGIPRTQIAQTVLQSAEASDHLLLVVYQNAMQRSGTPRGSTILTAAMAAIQQLLG